VIDPLAAAIGMGLLGPVVAGPAVAYVLDRIPEPWRRRTEWLLITGAVAVAILADVLQDGPGAGGLFIYVLAALPGFVTFLVWRSYLASALVSLAPMYFVIAILTRGRVTHTPEIALDRAIPVQPEWMLVYGSLYVFVLVLPLLVVRERSLIRRAMQSYLLVMVVSYVGFLLYPTAASRAGNVAGDGFGAWVLRFAYDLDPPYNCFPSLHVAYAFVSALSCSRVHRGVGAVAAVWAALIGISTLYTKQHYVVDVIGGGLAAYLAYFLFLRTSRREAVSDDDRRRAPFRALIAAAIFAVMVAGFWIAYRMYHPIP
jgi:membrane-associated phospholipid phosphatase